jgi:hypothetical protein
VEELLLAILEPLFELLTEFLLELFFGLFLAFLWRKARVARWKSRRISLWLILPLLAVVGALVGWISVPIVPSPIFHPGRVHGLSLIISPLLTGMTLGFIGSNLTRRKEMPAPLESFSGGFSFAFGMALIRFLNSHLIF